MSIEDALLSLFPSRICKRAYMQSCRSDIGGIDIQDLLGISRPKSFALRPSPSNDAHGIRLSNILASVLMSQLPY